jgi:acyl carrier protein
MHYGKLIRPAALQRPVDSSRPTIIFGVQVKESISTTADWYRLGGTSLKAIALAAAIKQQYSLPGSTAQLLQLSTIAQQAEYLQQHAAAASQDGGPQLRQLQKRSWADDHRPASSGQEQVRVGTLHMQDHGNQVAFYKSVHSTTGSDTTRVMAQHGWILAATCVELPSDLPTNA